MQHQGIEQITPDEARQRIDDGSVLVDVREADEYAQVRIPGALHLPLSQLADRWQELPEAPLVLQCAAGARSHQAALFLQGEGHTVANMVHGIQGWHAAGLPLESGHP